MSEHIKKLNENELISQGSMLLKHNNPQEALLYFTRLTEVEHTSSQGHLLKGLCLKNLKDYSGAIESFQYAVIYDNKNINAWNQSGICYELSGNFSKAVECYKAALEINPNDKDIWYNQAMAYALTDDLESALKAINKVISMDPADTEAQIKHIKLLIDSDNIDEAKYKAEKLEKELKHEEEYWFQKGRIAGIEKDIEKEIKYYTKALNINNNCFKVWNNLGVVLEEANQIELAEKFYQLSDDIRDRKMEMTKNQMEEMLKKVKVF